ncbi:DUF4430 domain-containing protein [Haloplasma contractile]|uniref:N-acetylmuramoyl-L-alanine amidase protein n=1 Tax=Haloplasma contractile SSD-17B TaxID=1033810 RepID=F7Q1N3_9MOLU|nr:DUF4430 domain-containing protein [Haloplasma contractile]ERJ12887.1 N-acetylmuramoyl-L-alanine amidase protein [Haloplasma contractile SSD-17B]
MKKIMSLISIFLLSLVLVACQNDELTSQIEDLESKLTSLETESKEKSDDLTVLQSEITSLKEIIAGLDTTDTNQQTTIDDLKSRLEALEEIYFDGIITVMIDHENDEFDFYKSIAYKSADELTLFELIKDNVTLSYEESTFGNFITGIGGLSPKTGAYIALYKNGEMALKGVDEISYDNGDLFKFKVEWFDQTEQAVDTAINTFVDNYASDYVNSESVDYHVASALYQLGILNDYVTLDEVTELYKGFDAANINESLRGKELFKAITIVTAVGGNPTDVDGNDLVEQLINEAPIGIYGTTALGSLALNAYDHGKDASTYEAAIITDLTTTNKPINSDVDTAGLTLIALSDYTDNDTVGAVIDETITYLSTDKQASTGGITSTDFWTDPDNPTEVENGASTAQVILGLLANGIDPTSEIFTKTDGNLITRLLDYQLEDGSFKYKTTDADSDTFFTTPQAFAALVMYQEFKNSDEATYNLYDFN